MMVRRCLRSGVGMLAGVLVLGAATHAAAEVKEPNGIAVPLDSNNGEMQLSALFSARGESIDFMADGSAKPDTFSPLCGFASTLVLKQTGSYLGVGWYNAAATRATAPDASEIFEIVPAGSQVGTVIQGADIRKHPSYAGGAIGFALIETPPQYSESRYNTPCSACTTPGPWVLSVSYRSTVTSNAYYVAFEDGATTSSDWSNDGDFNDYVFLFEGLTCVGEGDACKVPGAKGVCASGIRQCDAGSMLVCTSAVSASDEKCDGLDNDCDGKSDEDDSSCGPLLVCSRGQCVPRCGVDSEFSCAVTPFTQCEDGLCVDPACAGKTCADGQACIAGTCRAPCDGVTCPAPQACLAGKCLDACSGVQCSADRVCEGGACVLRCDCVGCGVGRECDLDSGRCVDHDCSGIGCDAGKQCKAGRCVDACVGASCPLGSVCRAGECTILLPGQDAGADLSATDAGITEGADTLDAGQGSSGGGGTSGGKHDAAHSGSSSGCGCRVAPGSGDPSAGTGLLALLLGALWIRRRTA